MNSKSWVAVLILISLDLGIASFNHSQLAPLRCLITQWLERVMLSHYLIHSSEPVSVQNLIRSIRPAYKVSNLNVPTLSNVFRHNSFDVFLGENVTGLAWIISEANPDKYVYVSFLLKLAALGIHTVCSWTIFKDFKTDTTRQPEKTLNVNSVSFIIFWAFLFYCFFFQKQWIKLSL